MKRRVYTRSHDIDLLKEIDNNGAIFTGDEHAYISERCSADFFKSKESLLHYYLSLGSETKLHALGFIIDYMNTNGFINVLSMGGGNVFLNIY